MNMRFLPGLAVAAILAAAAVPTTTVLAQGSLTKTNQPVACDCTNCSAQHCQPKGNVEYTWKIEEGTKSSLSQLGAPTVNRPRSRAHWSQN